MEISTLLLPLLSFLTSFLLVLFLPSLLHKTHIPIPIPNPNSPPSPQTPPIRHDHDNNTPSSTPSTPTSAKEEPLKEQQEEEKKRRKRGRKKKQQQQQQQQQQPKYPMFPFSSVTSSLQKRIKANYDEILKTANQSNVVTVPQVSEFIGCLVEARDELQHRSEQIQRSYKIKKALLSTANKSSFDRLWDEAHKLEKEHKRLEADAAVYNLLQEQLKLSPAYKTLLDLSVKMGKQAQDEETEDFPDISFEELLAQEKKDSIWQRNGKMRSFPK